MTIATPFRVKLLIHCSVHPCVEIPDVESKAVQYELKDLQQIGAIEAIDRQGWTATALGRAWVQAICNVKIPRMVFIDEQGKELNVR